MGIKNDLIVIKRDGRKEKFDSNKITSAIIKAILKVGKTEQVDDAYSITDDVLANVFYNFKDEINIKDIEKIVELTLMSYDKDIAREYTGYRSMRDASRSRSSQLMEKMTGMLNGSNKEITAENANKDANKINVQRDLLAGIVCKEIAFDLNMIPDRVVSAMKNNYIHYHDLDYSPVMPMYNCMLIDIKTMFEKGFIMNNAIISEPKSIQVASTVASQIVCAVASSQYGGQTINRFDEIMAKYVTMSYAKIVDEKLKEFCDFTNNEWISYNDILYLDESSIKNLDNSINSAFNVADIPNNLKNKFFESCHKRIRKEVHDAMQTFEYQVNTLFSSNGQSPFVSIGFGLGTSEESRLIQQEILNIRIEGIGEQHITPVFPKLLFTLCKGINFYPEDPNYDIKQLAMKCSSLRMYPDILNYENICKIAKGEVVYKDEAHRVVDIEKSTGFKACMGCRSFLHRWVNPETGKEEYDGRLNTGVISINLVKIALEARELTKNIEEREKYFFNKLNEILDISKEGLISRVDRLRTVKAKVAPILYGDSTLGVYGATGFSLHPDETIEKVFENGRASVSLGYVGLHETILALYNEKPFKNDKLIEKAENIMETLYNATQEWKKETGLAFSVYSTPAESLAGKFYKPDRNRFGIIEGITWKDWYTNSFHLDVEQEATAFEKLDFESHFVKYTPGGFTHHVDCHSLKNNPIALEALWDYAYEKTECGYMLINVKEDRCFDCGYIGEFTPTCHGYECPNCGNSNPNRQSVIRRISGYITDASSRPINTSKKEEIDHRYTHF